MAVVMGDKAASAYIDVAVFCSKILCAFFVDERDFFSLKIINLAFPAGEKGNSRDGVEKWGDQVSRHLRGLLALP
ncbi:hypothetical protein CfE428DRAFT_4004 [Chthoniobacter flavus Ellin428]|uniref:Uncharacterized protein n=1 Tax=Chthoniobacter flavus Ellin428 TaxID=497964 RepID=B4D515_9BACT|nr:hypothetical protein CfE428DRAFT_4004 [Chthoniobacter flavus Ellin428]TCO90926.1 hypothetical protein EV701_10975 [Chthoniobacter flavus]